MTRNGLARVNAAIGLIVGAGAGAAPKALLRVYGIPATEVTGTAEFGWRLFAARNLVVGAAAWRGDEAARDWFLPVQALDQVVFWHAYRRRSVPRSAAVAAAATSGVIVAIDVARRLKR